MRTSQRRVVVLLSALSILAAGCGGTGPEGSGGGERRVGTTFAEVEQLAREEGELVLYTSTHDGINLAEIEAFNQVYPEINVSYTRLVSGELTARFASETESGAVSGDVIKIADNALLEDRPEWFLPIDETIVPNLVNVPEDLVSDHYVHMMAGSFVVTVNSTQMADPPTQWEQLVQPPYLGEGIVVDPRASSSFMAMYAQMREWYGDEFLTAIADSGYQFYDSSATAVQQVGAGEVPFAGPGQTAHSKELRDAGAPLITSQLEPTLGLTHIAAVAANAENPNAALVYVNWLLTREGQSAACQGEYQAIAVQDLPDCPPAPADFTVVDPAKGQEQSAEILQLLGLE